MRLDQPAVPSPVQAAVPADDAAVPLVVDVDGTLIKTDLLHEAVLQVAARHPLKLLYILPWLMRGKAAMKKAIADLGDPGTSTVPLREETVAAIRDAQRAGRPVYLASASDRRYVQKLADRVGGIRGVFATDGEVNIAGDAKAERLVAAFGHGNFDYVGDADVDFAVWKCSRKVLALTHGNAFERRLLRAFPAAEIIAKPRPRLSEYARALRPHQWAKNILVFLPLIAGHLLQPAHIAAALLAFVSFSLAASSAYLINDLLDLPSDRDHARKRNRPLASGAMPVTHGAGLAIALMALAFASALVLPAGFLIVLAAYVASTLAYSFLLKRKMALDVVTLGGLYTMRVLAGITAVGASYSQWLLMFCLFLFLALAIAKRCSELLMRQEQGKGPPTGRGYRIEDVRVLLSFGAAAGYGAVFVVALYLSSPEVQALYTHPSRLALICPLLLYWITRIFIICNRGDLHDDPLVFALSDRTTWLTGVCAAGVLAIGL